jgi:hypothetical protein
VVASHIRGDRWRCTPEAFPRGRQQPLRHQASKNSAGKREDPPAQCFRVRHMTLETRHITEIPKAIGA